MRQRLHAGVAVGSLVVGLLVALHITSTASAATRPSVLKAAASYARSQGYHIGIAVYDTKTEKVYGSGDDTGRFASESIIKTMIATRLILQGRMSGSTARQAWKMITQSDDGIASAFYGSVGGDGLINWIKQHYHVPNLGSPPQNPGWWGNTSITPRGLVTWYAKVKRDPRVGPWLLRAMHHATQYGSDGTYQFFGLPSATGNPAVKQGWGCDFGSGCNSADFNTTGFVNGDRYAVAILARGPIGTYGSAIASMLTRTARLLLPGGHFPAPRPTVRELTRLKGRMSGGQRVGVYGTDFTNVRSVWFGKVRGSAVDVRGSHFLRVTTPAHAAGQVPIRVVTGHGTSSGGPRFTFGRAPAVSSLQPRAGPIAGGTKVTVTGVGLGAATQVMFGGVPGSGMHVVSGTVLTVVAPQHNPGTVAVRVVSPFGWSAVNAADRFTYADAPTVTELNPSTGPRDGGTQVTVIGTHLGAVTQVTFGGIAATNLMHVSPTELTVMTPAHQPGQVTVVASGPGGTSPAVPGAVFTYSS